MSDKKGEKDFEFIYAYLSVFAYIEFMHLVFLRRMILNVKQKGRESFWKKEF